VNRHEEHTRWLFVGYLTLIVCGCAYVIVLAVLGR
jgi:hypothetical protein